MSNPVYTWYFHDHADEYLLAGTHYLARATTRPITYPLPPAAVSATLFSAFAGEAYVNVALLRLIGESEYAQVEKLAVRSKYYLATRLGLREAWFTEGEAILETLGELFTQRNRLAHHQPEGRLHPDVSSSEDRPPWEDLRNVARWLLAVIEAVDRLSRSHAELAELNRVARPLLDLEPTLRRFDPDDDGKEVGRVLHKVMAGLWQQEAEFRGEEELEALMHGQDSDWDLRGIGGRDAGEY